MLKDERNGVVCLTLLLFVGVWIVVGAAAVVVVHYVVRGRGGGRRLRGKEYGWLALGGGLGVDRRVEILWICGGEAVECHF